MKKKLYVFKTFLIFFLIIASLYTWTNLNNNNIVTDYVLLLNESNVETNNSLEKDIINEYIKKYKNKEVVGEISILGTDYKKALVQHSNNDYYLNHTESKKSNYMGAIFLDFRVNINTSRKLLIFGHNSSKVNMPFKILDNYYDKDYYLEHPYIQIVTSNGTRLYKIYSVYVETKDFDYMKTDFNDDNEWYNHISKFKKKSLYDTGVDISKEDNILILQTCSTHKKYMKYKDKYLLVTAKEEK